MAHTGEICNVSGIYKCDMHPEHLVIIYAGDTFYACNKKTEERSTKWTLIKQIKQ
jgi:hypothetical protein